MIAKSSLATPASQLITRNDRTAKSRNSQKPASKKRQSVWILGILFAMLLCQVYLFVLLPRNTVPSSLPLQVKESHTKKKIRRRFLNYTSSQWESMWLQNISQWEKDRSICENLQSSEQAEYLHKFQTTLCTHHPLASAWCAVDDPYAYARYLYNTVDRTYATNLPDLSWEDIVSPSHPPQPVVPPPEEDIIRQVFSRFYFLDETTGEVYTEYIEPLVSHLRHPLALCPPLPEWGIGRVLMLSRSFVVPPPPSGRSFPKTYYFDAGSSIWDDGGGGPSLKYFTTVWKRHGIDFDHIEAWEGTVGTEEFYATVPDNYKNRTFFHSEYIASSPETNGTFLPLLILNSTDKED
mmetsp:Transcript_20149/g.28681  ORF Transcript_20149/g.28681 Transcript_20149/m.28681 type:complete len:350 (+) Transcript_20149:317-1366(+)